MSKFGKEQTNLRNNKGLTLVELMIVMVMMAAILAVGYSFYFLGVKSFTMSTNRSDAQYETRRAMQFISKNVSNANYGKVSLDDGTAAFDSASKYIYRDSTTKLLMYKNAGSAAVIEAGTANGITFDAITFTCPANGVLGINITARSSGTNTQTYSVSTKVLLLNDPNGASFNTSTYSAASYSRIKISPLKDYL